MLDTEPHVLTSLTITETASVHVVEPVDIHNRNWLISGIKSRGQQEFGDRQLAEHKFVVIPSVVSSHSWNLLFIPTNAASPYQMREQVQEQEQEPFSLGSSLFLLTSSRQTFQAPWVIAKNHCSAPS